MIRSQGSEHFISTDYDKLLFSILTTLLILLSPFVNHMMDIHVTFERHREEIILLPLLWIIFLIRLLV